MNRLRKEIKILAVSLTIVLTLAISIAAYTYVYSATNQANIADNVIRFHVVANSDSSTDQEIKDIVRDAILTEFEELLHKTDNIEKSRQLLKAEMVSIQTHAEKAVQKLGFNYPVMVQLETTFFPTQVYGDLSFPPGMYEALRIVIGEGVGQNWWCLMFPPLCFVDMTSTSTGRQQLFDNVSEEAYRLLTHQDEDAVAGTQVRFRIVEWWQNRR